MGSGKSVTGKKLASLLNCEFHDLDELIQAKAGKSIREIFENEGESYFRDLESEVVRGAANAPSAVIATGGGTVLRPENVQSMRRSGKIIFLETSLNMLWDRVKNKKDRPLLKGDNPKENLERIYKEREKIYRDVCDFEVNTDGQTAEQVALKIMDVLEPKK